MRHGHVDYFAKAVLEGSISTSDVPLTALGREQAEAAGRAIAHVKFDRAVCSGYPRTRETAEIVLRHNEVSSHLSLESDDELVEIKSGSFLALDTPDRSRAAMAARMAFEFDAAHKPDARMLGGEVFAEAIARGQRGMERVLAVPRASTTLVVAHEGINRLILAWMTGAGLAAVRAFEQDLACVNILDFDMAPREDGAIGTEIQRAMIKAVNLTPYNWTKHGMNLTSLETIFERYEAPPESGES
jgi:probable phosphoglycerate mutase